MGCISTKPRGLKPGPHSSRRSHEAPASHTRDPSTSRSSSPSPSPRSPSSTPRAHASGFARGSPNFEGSAGSLLGPQQAPAARARDSPTPGSDSSPRPPHSYQTPPPPHASRLPWSTSPAVLGTDLPSVQAILTQKNCGNQSYRNLSEFNNPNAVVYRIYINILSGRRLELRNEIERFWSNPQWRVSSIPEPPMTGRQERAVLACVTYLLVKAFNRLIKLGLPRDAPPSMSDKMLEEMQSRPKVFESVPRWAELVEPLSEPLFIPDAKGRVPGDRYDSDVDGEMLRKNILTFTLPVFFA